MARSKIRLIDALEEFLAVHLRRREIGPETAEGYRTVILPMARMLRNPQVASIRDKHLDDFFYGPKGLMSEHDSAVSFGCKHKALSESTHNAYRWRVIKFFRWMRERGYTNVDPKDTVRELVVQEKHRERHAPQVLLRILDAADNPRDRAFIAAALNTAKRSSDLISLRRGNVDLESGWIYFTIKKTKQADTFPITEELDRELRRWFEEYETELGRPLQSEDYLFPHRYGGLIHHYETAEDGTRYPVRDGFHLQPHKTLVRPERVVKKALDRLGLPTIYEGTHTLRRAVARAYFDAAATEAGGDIMALRETSSMLNHADIRTTAIYLGTTPEKERRDRRLKGKSFLPGMIDTDNVIPLRPTASEE